MPPTPARRLWGAAFALAFLPLAGAADVVVGHFGDSTCITSYLPREQRVDVLLNAQLAARYKDQRVNSRNLAAGGDTVRRFLDSGRYRADVVDKIPHLEIALIRYGHNDRKTTPPGEFKKHLAELCDRLSADYPGVHLVLETNTFLPRASKDDFDACWDAVRELARERRYPLVDIHARRKAAARAGLSDQCIRNQKLAMEQFGVRVLDASRDAEMKDVPGWFSDAHPNAATVAIMADEEFQTLARTWPERLPVARTAPP
jgi:lysophospholipase L1-like esterase